MKKFSLIALLMFTTISAMGAGLPQPNENTQALDARRPARALVSLNPTVFFSGSYGFTRTKLDGTTEHVWYWFEAKYYKVFSQDMIKPYKIMLDNVVIYNDVNNPLDVIPYNNIGVASCLDAYMYGYDAAGQNTTMGEFHSASWAKDQPFVFTTRPGTQPVVIPIILGDRKPGSVGLIVQEWGPYAYPYSIDKGGVYLWVDPTVTYHYQVVDMQTKAPIGSPGTFCWGELPQQGPAGSALAQTFEAGVQMVKFDQYNFYSSSQAFFNTQVLENNSPVPAAVYGIDQNELQGQLLSLGIGHFAGRLQVEYVSADGSRKLVIDKVFNDPSQWSTIDLPEGGLGIVISIIKENMPILVQQGQPTPDVSYFYLNIGRGGAVGMG